MPACTESSEVCRMTLEFSRATRNSPQRIRTGKDSQDGGSNAAGTLQAGTHRQGGCPKISRIRSFQQHGHKLVSPEPAARRRNCCQFQSKRGEAALGKHTTLSIVPQLFTAV